MNDDDEDDDDETGKKAWEQQILKKRTKMKNLNKSRDEILTVTMENRKAI